MILKLIKKLILINGIQKKTTLEQGVATEKKVAPHKMVAFPPYKGGCTCRTQNDTLFLVKNI